MLYQTSPILLVLLVFLTDVSLLAANRPPELEPQSSAVLITGSSSQSPVDFSIQLRATDSDGDYFTYGLLTSPNTNMMTGISLSSVGLLKLIGVCSSCTGTASFKLKVEDVHGNKKEFTVPITIRDRQLQPADIKLEPAPSSAAAKPAASKGLETWHIYLILLGVIFLVTVTLSLIVYNCCTFTPTPYELPLRKPNKVMDKPVTERSDSMNPYAKPKKKSLIVREAIRSGAADGAPYYGSGKRGVWVPEAEKDDPKPQNNPSNNKPIPPTIPEDRRDTLKPLQSDADANPPRRKTFAAAANSVRASRRLSQDMSLFGQVPWSEITQPRQSFQY